jgi:hypothetical protein
MIVVVEFRVWVNFNRVHKFFVLSYVGFLMNLVMVFSSCPIMNVRDINFNDKVLLVFARYDNNNISNVQVA